MKQELPSHIPIQKEGTAKKGEGGVEIFTTRVADLINWGRKNSLWPMPMGISCCAIEMMAFVASKYDAARFGSEALRFSPRQADLMIVAGTLTKKMAPAVRQIYDQMPEPKWVMAMGACLITGGMFDSYPVVQGLDHVIPVDVYVPGCPPRPEGVLQGLMQIQKQAQASGKINLVSRAQGYVPDVELTTLPTDEKPTQKQTMIINMGPSHPSTHGVLRLVLEVDGETIVKAHPHVGYLHRGFEKLGENRTYHQFIPYTDRLDYMAALNNNIAYVMAVEKLMDIELTPRNQMLRTLCCELSRLSAHLLSLGTYALDLGAATIFFHTFQERENIYALQEKLAGSRMLTAYARVGGLARDMPEGWMQEILDWLPNVERVLDEAETLLNKNAIWVHRTENIGVINQDLCRQYGITGPIARAAGIPLDLRKDHPYLAYDQLDFDVPVGTAGDAYDRYMVRMIEMRQSIRLVRQAIQKMPDGPLNSDVPGVVLPPRDRIFTSMEELIYHFKIIGSGFMPPAGKKAYHSIEAPKGELGFYVVSEGGPNAYRLRIKSPSFTNLQLLSEVLPGLKIADAVTTVASLDPVMGECDR